MSRKVVWNVRPAKLVVKPVLPPAEVSTGVAVAFVLLACVPMPKNRVPFKVVAGVLTFGKSMMSPLLSVLNLGTGCDTCCASVALLPTALVQRLSRQV